MYNRLIKNDIMKTKFITITTMAFVAAAALLVSLAAILVVHLTSAMNTMMEKAVTPHFLQMHIGDIDHERLENFAENQENVADFQVMEFIGIDNALIQLGDNTLAENVQDNGFSKQSERFDFLLDLDGNVIDVADGELYVPIAYMNDGTTEIGDTAIINGKELTVAGFLRDSQMNSTLASSKRFLISEHDLQDIKAEGTTEYLIEFLLEDYSGIGEFEAAYASAGLEANGPTLTWSLFQMINVISDGMLIAIILLISVLIIIVAFMSIRFTLIAKMEDDYREIGVMKAIGLPLKDIRHIFLAKYVFIAAVSSVVGFLLSFVFAQPLTENIRLYMGESEHGALGFILGLLGVTLVFVMIIAYVNHVLRRFRHISAAEAIRFGVAEEKTAGAKRFKLSKNKWFSTNIFLGLKDVLGRKKLYATSLIILIIATFIMIVPQNLYATISSKSFIHYMGIGDSDLRVQTSDEDKVDEMITQIASDQDIFKYGVLSTRIYKIKTPAETEENLKIELGDHAVFPIAYTEGAAPTREDEISLSLINASELEKSVGDDVIVVVNGEDKKLTVSGIYSDITNGGKTAKALFDDESAALMWTIVPIELIDSSLTAEKVAAYEDMFDYAKTANIDEYISQTMGSTMESVKMAAYASIAIAIIISILVTILFMRMLIAKDRYAIAVTKAIGFTNADIRKQYLTRSVFILIIAVVAGTILANTLGESIAGLAISAFGAGTFDFVVNPLFAYVLSPLLLLVAVLLATSIGIARAGKINLAENIKE